MQEGIRFFMVEVEWAGDPNGIRQKASLKTGNNGHVVFVINLNVNPGIHNTFGN